MCGGEDLQRQKEGILYVIIYREPPPTCSVTSRTSKGKLIHLVCAKVNGWPFTCVRVEAEHFQGWALHPLTHIKMCINFHDFFTDDSGQDKQVSKAN